jgi:cytochrome b561
MPKQSTQRNAAIRDSDSVYGWVSIALHWITAATVVALWFIGKSIFSGDPDAMDARRSLHVSIAASAWLLILVRIIWRFREGHPHVRGQSMRIHRIARAAHYAMLTILLVMILSGPLMVWADGAKIDIFGLASIAGPFGASEALRSLAWYLHSKAAVLLLVLVLLHIGGALKHLMFHDDDTIVRMIWPEKVETS